MILFALAAAVAQPTETPSGFVARFYAQYRKQAFGSLERPENWYAPRLLAAIKDDSRLAQGEIGYLEGDPLCGCQDYDRISARITSYRRPSSNTALVRVYVDLGFGPQDARYLRLSLTLTSRGWRVADVSSSDEPSLLRALQRSNATQRRR